MRRRVSWLVLGWIAGVIIFTTEVVAQEYKEGDEIGSYRGVPAYSNGGNLNTFHQCIKYVQRFFAEGRVAGVTITGWGNATDFFGNGPKYNFVAYAQYAQGSQVPPLPNEILCFGGGWGNYGHVAIITEVNISGGYIKIIDQNRTAKRENIILELGIQNNNGYYFIKTFDSSYYVQGWLALPFRHPAGTLIKTVDSPRTYVILESSKKIWLPDENVFRAHGFSFGKIVTVSQSEMNSYPDYGRVASSSEPYILGNILRDSADILFKIGSQVYLYDSSQNRKRKVYTYEIMQSWGYDWANLTNSPPAYARNASTGDPLWYRDGTLVRGQSSPAVYVVERGYRRSVQTWEVFLALGYNQDNIIWLPDNDINNNLGFRGKGSQIDDTNIWQPDQIVKPGHLAINSSPGGAEVYERIGDREFPFPNPRATTPVAAQALAPSTYTFVLRKQGYQVGSFSEFIISNNTKVADIALTSVSHSVLSIPPTSLDFGVDENQKTIYLSNSGTGTLTWSASDNANWLICSPVSGSGNATLTLSVSRTNLSSGAYYATLSITSNGGNQSVAVSMQVSSNPPPPPPPPATNLIANSDFSQGFNSWLFEVHDGQGCLANWELVDGALKVRILELGSNASSYPYRVQVKQTIATLKPNTKYLLKFDFKGTIPWLVVTISKNEPDWSMVGIYQTVNVSNAWQTREFIFTTPASIISNNKLNFQIGSSLGEFYLDRVVLEEVDSINPPPPPPSTTVILDELFSQSLGTFKSEIHSNVNAAIVWRGNYLGTQGVAVIDVYNSATFYEVQFKTFIPVQTNGRYRLEFRAMVNVARKVQIQLLKDTDPWTSYGFWQEVNLTGFWQTYSYDFTATYSDPQARLTFHAGSEIGSIYLDWVKVTKLSSAKPVLLLPDDQSVLPTQFELFQNHPNPFNPETRIDYRLLEDSQVKLEIFNTLGQSIAILVDEFQTAGIYSVVWRGQDRPAGVYFLILQAGNFKTVKKMSLIK